MIKLFSDGSGNRNTVGQKIFLNKFHFLQFQKGQKKSIFELGKSLKLPKIQFHRQKNEFIWFHEFFCLAFFSFSGPLWIGVIFDPLLA